MGNNKIKHKDFITDIFVASFLSKTYIPFADFSGFIKNENEVVLFDYKEIELYLNNFKSMKVYGLNSTECENLKKRGLPFSKLKVTNTCLRFNEDFFQLKGHQYKKIRNSFSLYTQRKILEIKDDFKTVDEIIQFLDEWKLLRKDAHFRFFTGYEVNFIKKYYHKFRNRLVCKFFYYMNKLVGFTVIERVNNCQFNLLFRKSNTDFTNLCLFIDYFSFKEIYDEIQETFIVNMGSDISDKGMNYYKTKSFHVETQVDVLYDIKIKETSK